MMGELNSDLLQEIIQLAASKSGSYATVGDNQYSVYFDSASSVLYFFDASSEYEATVGLVTTRPVIGVVSVDKL